MELAVVDPNECALDEDDEVVDGDGGSAEGVFNQSPFENQSPFDQTLDLTSAPAGAVRDLEKWFMYSYTMPMSAIVHVGDGQQGRN